MTPVGLVIAGGEGTRMSTSFPATPKALVEVAGISLIEHVVRSFRRAGVREIWFALRHRAEEIIAHIERRLNRGDGEQFTFLVEEEPLGTIGALASLRHETRCVLVANGDLLSGIDLRAMLRFHRQQGSDLTIATHQEHHRLKLGEVETGPDHRIVAYHEKPVKEYRISSGTYLVEPGVRALVPVGEWFAFPALVNRALETGLHVAEFFHTEPWFDVNDEHDLTRARDLVREDPAAFGLDADWHDRGV